MAENDSVQSTKPAPSRPTITLPPRPPIESLLGVGGFGTSPGPMTLVSSFFPDGDSDSNYRSFSQLLAGAIASPLAAEAAAAAAPPPPAQRPGFSASVEAGSASVQDAVVESGSGGGGGGGGGVGGDVGADFRLKQNGPPGLVVTQPQRAVFTIPPGLSPAALLDSPILFPGQGSFGMSHQQALAHVTAQAAQAPNLPSSLAVAPPSTLAPFSSSTMEALGQHNVLLSATDTKKESSELSDSDQRIQPTVDKPADDGYNWRKYGQKQVKGGEFPRSYYKCTYPNCPVKKKVERSLEGLVAKIVYKGQHEHPKPSSSKRSRETGNTNVNSSIREKPGNTLQGQSSGVKGIIVGAGFLQPRKDHESNQPMVENLSSDEEEENSGTGVCEGDVDELQSKRRNTEVKGEQPTSHRALTEPKIIVQTTSEVDFLDDGYKWRKYGQKVVKGNPHPRSYYKCTYVGCKIRKHVERASSNPKAVITTYEGKHNHDVPAIRSSSHNSNSNNAPQKKPQNLVANENAIAGRADVINSNQQPVVLRFKEEKTT